MALDVLSREGLRESEKLLDKQNLVELEETTVLFVGESDRLGEAELFWNFYLPGFYLEELLVPYLTSLDQKPPCIAPTNCVASLNWAKVQCGNRVDIYVKFFTLFYKRRILDTEYEDPYPQAVQIWKQLLRDYIALHPPYCLHIVDDYTAPAFRYTNGFFNAYISLLTQAKVWPSKQDEQLDTYFALEWTRRLFKQLSQLQT